jgi:hypothetical protein
MLPPSNYESSKQFSKQLEQTELELLTPHVITTKMINSLRVITMYHDKLNRLNVELKATKMLIDNNINEPKDVAYQILKLENWIKYCQSYLDTENIKLGDLQQALSKISNENWSQCKYIQLG